MTLGAAALIALATPGPAHLYAQGITTGSVTGTVSDPSAQLLSGAQVQLRNPATGYGVSTTTRANGLYLIQGVEPGAGYVITVRRIGFEPQARENINITLSQTRREDFKLETRAAVLTGVQVTATTDPVINASKTGTGTTVSDSALHRLPTLNRNFSDFVQLVPQVSTTIGIGLSGGGVNARQNAIQIDGAQAGDIFGIGTTGNPGSQANAKSIPLDAVKEYQVLLSPFDVRQGNFGGLLINAVTKSGTNQFHGSVFGYTRNQDLTRKQSYLTDFSQQQYGASVGGPILKDRLFFFASGDFQKLQTPALGPYIGSSDSPVAAESITQLATIMKKYGLTDPGDGEQVQKQNPNQNVFARIDANLPFNTRLVLRNNYVRADNLSFSRSSSTSASPNFNLTSNQFKFSSKTNSFVAEFLTNLPSGAFNELLYNNTTTNDFRTVPVRFPQLTVRGIPRIDATTTASFVLGTEASSQGNALDQHTVEITDNVSIPVATHTFTVGVKDQFYRPINLFGQNSLGSWTFADLNSLNNGVASQYQVSAPSPTDPVHGLATFRTNMLAFYAQDAWQITSHFSVTAGLRFDKPHFSDTPPDNPVVFMDYARHTSNVPNQAQVSPRIGFNWDVTDDQANQLRGGVGQFTGPPPFVYFSNAFGNSGLTGYASLTCTGSTTGTASLAVPVFDAQSIATPPTSCAAAAGKPGATIATAAAVNTIDPDFQFPKYKKASVGYDHRFKGNFIGTVEGLYTRSTNNAFYQNLALIGPQGTDAHGRTLYGILTATGGTPTTKGGRTQVLDLTNSSGDVTWSVTGQLQKTFATNFEGSISYTYQQARDVTSTTSSTAGSNYRFQRDVSGSITDKSVTKSKYDQPHRIIGTGTYRVRKTFTDLSVIYTGSSGAPYDYVYLAGTGTGSGDANADGQTANDLVYVPKSAADSNEILFTGYNGTVAQQAQAAAQAAAFDKFIDSVDCLKSARGTIMKRNACRNPWVNEIDISVAQGLGRRFRNLQARVDVINFANLLNKNWGAQAFSDQGATCGPICSATGLLTQSGNRLPSGLTNSPSAQGIYTFDPNLKAFDANNASSNYRIQLSVRYSF